MCGGALTIRKTNSKDPREIYSCSTYIHKGKAHCSQHRVDAEEKLDAQSQQWAEDIGSYTDITELDANILNRLISKIVISESQDDESNNSHAVEMEIHFNLSPIPELGTIERGSSSIRYF